MVMVQKKSKCSSQNFKNTPELSHAKSLRVRKTEWPSSLFLRPGKRQGSWAFPTEPV